MEYGTEIKCGEIMDDSYVRFVGYNDFNIDLNYYFSKENVGIISKEITNLLKGVDPDNRPIIVPDMGHFEILTLMHTYCVSRKLDPTVAYYIYCLDDSNPSNNFLLNIKPNGLLLIKWMTLKVKKCIKQQLTETKKLLEQKTVIPLIILMIKIMKNILVN